MEITALLIEPVFWNFQILLSLYLNFEGIGIPGTQRLILSLLFPNIKNDLSASKWDVFN